MDAPVWTSLRTTDEDLRLRTSSDAAAAILRVDPSCREGREVADRFQGTDLPVVEAHLAALEGRAAGFALGLIASRGGPHAHPANVRAAVTTASTSSAPCAAESVHSSYPLGASATPASSM